MRIYEVMNGKNERNNLYFEDIFLYEQNSLEFQDAQEIRCKVVDFLAGRKISRVIIDNINLSITEILSNLVKHPKEYLSILKITIKNSDDRIELDVMDNSTPFDNFDIEIANTTSLLNNIELGAENGFGLGLISKSNQEITYISKDNSNDKFNHFKAMQKIDTPTMPQEKSLIFLIDDDPISLTIYTEILKNRYNVMRFKNAQDALDAFPKEKPSLIVSDLLMPEINGIELRKKLSKLEDGDTTPFIFISSDKLSEHDEHIDDLGVDDFLCKPVKPEKLHHVVSRLLKRSKQIKTSIKKEVDEEITQLFKPYAPENYKGWSFNLKSIVADAGGGDFIYHEVDKEKLTVILADVMGHGKKAKFFAYVYAGYLNSIFRMNTLHNNAANILQFLSNSINNDRLLECVILTCQCFQLFRDGTINIASAGHPYPILIKNKTKKAELIKINGALPGLTDDNTYNLLPLKLDQGDKILFITDGFLENFDKTELSVQDLLDTLNKNADLSSSDLLKHIWAEYDNKITNPNTIKDDATTLIIEYSE